MDGLDLKFPLLLQQPPPVESGHNGTLTEPLVFEVLLEGQFCCAYVGKGTCITRLSSTLYIGVLVVYLLLNVFI